MTGNPFYILEEDKQLARQRIAELEREILELGPEFHTALTQSTETWHDNAPFDALREKQAVLEAELLGLKEVLQKADISVPQPQKGRVSVGSRVKVLLKGKIQHFFLRLQGRCAEQHKNTSENFQVDSAVHGLSLLRMIFNSKRV